MAPAVIVRWVEEGVVRITLNRPEALNSINHELLDGFVDALRSSARAQVIVIDGAGNRSFCAGEDLKQTLIQQPGLAEELEKALHKLQDITRLTSLSKPIVVAAVQGFAIGGGAEIALAADFIIGGPDTKYRFPEVTIGHAVTGGISARLPHLVGLLRAKEILITGRWIEAQEALKLGLLTEIAEDPKKRAMELALSLASLPTEALASSKMSLERATFGDMEHCLADEVRVAANCFAHEDASKAFANFATRKSVGELASARTVNQAWARASKQFADRPFLRFTTQDRDISFSEFDSIVGRLAGGLKSAGVSRGQRVLVMMRNSPEMITLWLASNRLGAVWVPINTEIKSVTLKGVIEAAQPAIVVADSDLWKHLDSLQVVSRDIAYTKGYSTHPGPKSLDVLLETGLVVQDSAKVSPDETASFLYTSGTTGRSKPCMLSHEYFVIQAEALIDSFSLQSDDVLFCPFPLFHVDATALTVMPAILLGATAAFSVRFSASRFWDDVRTTKATVYNFMGATLALTWKQPPSSKDQEHRVRLAWGVPIPDFVSEYEKRFGHRVVTLYGSVEAGVPCYQDLSLPSPYGSCGRLRSGFQARICNSYGEESPTGMTGQLQLKTANRNSFFQGYFNDSESTNAALVDPWLNTGDLARIDAHGNLFFVGRIKDVIRRRGENVNASEVEEEFLQHEDVLTVAAYGIPSHLGRGTEQDIKVAIEKRPGSSLSEKDIWSWATKRMARFQIPDVVQFVDYLHRTPTGKIDKSQLTVEGGHRFSLHNSKL